MDKAEFFGEASKVIKAIRDIREQSTKEAQRFLDEIESLVSRIEYDTSRCDINFVLPTLVDVDRMIMKYLEKEPTKSVYLSDTLLRNYSRLVRVVAEFIRDNCIKPEKITERGRIPVEPMLM